MKLPLTLSRYISWHFFIAIVIATFGLVAITSLIDFVELLRRAASRESVPFMVIVHLTVLKMPYMMERLVPYAVLIGSMLALTRLTRTHELIVARAAGISVWQFLMPALMVVLILGSVMTTIFNPVAAALLLRFEQVEARYFSNRGSLMVISSSGLWMRQMEDNNTNGISEHIINASRLSQADMSFSKVIIFSFDQKKKFVERLDAVNATLTPGMLTLSQVTRSRPGKPPESLPSYALPTSLTMEYIQDSFASPETMSFWRLPGFINILEEAGFSAIRHRLYFHTLLANPFLMAGMVWVAAVFSLRLPRRGKIGLLIVAGLITGFMLYFFTNLIHSIGAAGTLPIQLAAWAPALVMLMIGAVLLLHIEDG